MRRVMATSISLPEIYARYWQNHRREVMDVADRYLRLIMRFAIRRETTVTYNRAKSVRYRANYCLNETVWNPEAGIYEESLTFWAITPENPTG
jgi:hypothetical protein